MVREYSLSVSANSGIAVAYRSVGMISVGLALLVSLSGCLLSPDAEYIQPAKHQPPHIENPAPAPWDGLVVQGPACGSAVYQVSVVMPEPIDVLHWRVLVDYANHRDQDPRDREEPYQDQAVTLTFTIEGTDYRFDAHPNLPHMVELIVSDLQFYSDTGRAVAEQGHTDSIMWTVRYTQDPQCG
jgi:hypothetical protein